MSNANFLGAAFDWTIRIEIMGDLAAVDLGAATWVIEMNKPPTSAPVHITLSCNSVDESPVPAGTDISGSHAYEASGDTFRLLSNVSAGWVLDTFVRQTAE